MLNVSVHILFQFSHFINPVSQRYVYSIVIRLKTFNKTSTSTTKGTNRSRKEAGRESCATMYLLSRHMMDALNRSSRLH